MSRTRVTIELTHGPLDGGQFTDEGPLQVWFQVNGGYYVLTRYHEAPTGLGSRAARASYAWQHDHVASGG